MTNQALNLAADFDPETRACEDNGDKLAQVAEAYLHGRDINFPGAQKHIRFSWQRASSPLVDLLEDLYVFFESAAAVSVAGGGTHPFDRESVHLAIDLTAVKEVISHEGMGAGLALLGTYLKDPAFQAMCARHHVHEVFTPSNDLAVPARRVSYHNQPRPL